MATIAGIIFRGKEIEKAYDSQRQKHKHFVRALIDIVKVRKGSPFKIYTHISWPDPMFHEVDAPSYTDTEELTKWKELIPKQKYR